MLAFRGNSGQAKPVTRRLGSEKHELLKGLMKDNHNDNFPAPHRKRAEKPIHSVSARLEFESEPWAPISAAQQGVNYPFGSNRELEAYHRLAISPFRFEDLLSIWRAQRPSQTSRNAPAMNIILDCEVDGAKVNEALDVLRLLHRRTIELVGPDTAEGLLVLDDSMLALYGRTFDIRELALVRVEGPIDRRDIVAMLSNAAQGRSPLEAELRGLTAAEFRREGPTIIESRNVEILASALGLDIVRYVESILRVPPGGVIQPPHSEVMRLLARSGSIRIHAQDTELLGTNVDVGICTALGRSELVADTSLIYCCPEGTWHAREAA